jgi:hypothetical protein
MLKPNARSNIETRIDNIVMNNNHIRDAFRQLSMWRAFTMWFKRLMPKLDAKAPAMLTDTPHPD